MYRNCLFDKKPTEASFYTIESRNHTLSSKRVKKQCLSPYEDKRYILQGYVRYLGVLLQRARQAHSHYAGRRNDNDDSISPGNYTGHRSNSKSYRQLYKIFDDHCGRQRLRHTRRDTLAIRVLRYSRAHTGWRHASAIAAHRRHRWRDRVHASKTLRATQIRAYSIEAI